MKNLFRQKSLIIILVVFALSLAFFSHFRLNNPAGGNTALFMEKDKNPARLKIPKLGIEAHFEYVGLTPDGRMDVPKAPLNVAWFSLGPRPGEAGSSVISGHSGYKDNKPAVFDNLHKLKKGDKIYVEDSAGKKITFVVRKLKNYDKNAILPEVFTLDDGLAHLNLVTCTGDWNTAEKTHSERLVVFTDRE